MTTIPKYLYEGDVIGIVCPAGYMDFEKAKTAIEVLRDWGFKVKLGQTILSESKNYFSGTDEERINDLQLMLDDPEIKAIFCGRGGYGTSRIIDRLSFKKFKVDPKWIIGYSDITVLHSHIYSKFRIASLHAPMAASFNNNEYENEYVQSLRQALTGRNMYYESAPHPFSHEGKASGDLVGGNLSLLAHLVGTRSELKTKNRILFIEDIGEYIYSTDRMLYQLKRAGAFKKLAGLIVGGFTEVKDTPLPFGKTVEEVIHEMFKDADFPVAFGFPVSHSRENYALKVGVRHELIVRPDGVVLREA
jgi:muramoyltetrapeptide carboxypeptidase